MAPPFRLAHPYVTEDEFILFGNVEYDDEGNEGGSMLNRT